jgi:hypothetical protein
LAVREDDVHHPKQQQIGHFTTIGHEFGEDRFTDAKMVGQRLIASRYFGGGSQQSHGIRAHRLFTYSCVRMSFR